MSAVEATNSANPPQPFYKKYPALTIGVAIAAIAEVGTAFLLVCLGLSWPVGLTLSLPIAAGAFVISYVFAWLILVDHITIVEKPKRSGSSGNPEHDAIRKRTEDFIAKSNETLEKERERKTADRARLDAQFERERNAADRARLDAQFENEKEEYRQYLRGEGEHQRMADARIVELSREIAEFERQISDLQAKIEQASTEDEKLKLTEEQHRLRGEIGLKELRRKTTEEKKTTLMTFIAETKFKAAGRHYLWLVSRERKPGILASFRKEFPEIEW